MSLSTSPILAAAASNDVAATRWLIEHERVHVDQMGDWFAPQGGAAESNASTTAIGNKHSSLECKRRTPLMVAATHGSVDALSYLLRAGADPNHRSDDDERASALHCAASGGSAMSVECITTLLRFGADGKALDGFGREPADVLPVNGAQHDGGEARQKQNARQNANQNAQLNAQLNARAPFARRERSSRRSKRNERLIPARLSRLPSPERKAPPRRVRVSPARRSPPATPWSPCFALPSPRCLPTTRRAGSRWSAHPPPRTDRRCLRPVPPRRRRAAATRRMRRRVRRSSPPSAGTTSWGARRTQQPSDARATPT